ncbi:MAG: serine hydrolase domain-containing protein [Vicinamibacterales bacterium]
MSRLAPVAVLLALTAAASAAAGRQATPVVAPATIGLDPAALAEATALLERLVAEGHIAGAVAAVARHGQVGYLQAVGLQDVASRTPMTERSLFRIYSMTKAVTAVAVMMLHDEGRFRLDDPVATFLPEFAGVRVVDGPGAAPRPPARAVTVEDLLLHTSGLSHRTSDLYRALGVRSRADTLPEFVRKIARAPLMEDPHTRFRYSEGTTVLGRLVEIWSGQPFDAFLSARIFRPLGMTDAVFWVDGPRRGRLASVYGPGPAGHLVPVDIEPVPFTERPALIEGAVGLVTSVPDFLRFQQMLLAGGTVDGVRLLKADTAGRIVQNGLPPDVLQARGGRMGWGLGNVNVLMAPDGAGAHAGEYGWDGTAGTIFWNDPVTDTAIVLMTQSVPPNPGRLRQQFKALIQRAVQASAVR